MFWTEGMLCVLIALLLDGIFGEPSWLWRKVTHPAILMGRVVSWLDSTLNTDTQQTDRTRRARGIVALIAMVLTAGGIGLIISALPLGAVWSTLIAAILIAQRSLCDHVAAVGTGLQKNIETGRTEVAKIVGRDTGALDETGVARAAIESGAENFSDGIVAPVFWFVVAGLPGILIYKMVNTADSMIGYRNEKYLAFGWASARFDDLLNLIPARLSACLIALQSLSLKPIKAALRDASLHRSPNAGWPEAAMAACLDTSLSGPRIYEGKATEDPYVWPEGRRALFASDVQASVRILWRSWAVILIATALAMALS
ncbi:MAG: adenosylcobinamide-phosphate synthase CbiB [Pikeienuella sp.]